MNKMLRFLFSLSLGLMISSFQAQINTYPYLQDFDDMTLCSVNCEDSCTLSQGWTNDSNDVTDWIVATGSTISIDTGPTQDHTSGAGNYLYVEGYPSCDSNSVAILNSPVFDVSQLFSPELSFWFHMYGFQIGYLKVEVSTNGPAGPWSELVSAFTDDVEQWQLQQVDLSPYVVEGEIQLRFVHQDNVGIFCDMGLDDIRIGEAMPSSLIEQSRTDAPVKVVNSSRGEILLINDLAVSIPMRILNLTGQTLDKFNVKPGHSYINISSLPTGLLLLQSIQEGKGFSHSVFNPG